VKPETVVRVELWPMSMVDGLAATVGAVRIGLTVTVTGAEATVSDAPSVTWSSKDQVPVVERAPVETEGCEPAVQVKELPMEP
jgi:hypothetical protein